jgi:hypothetical protein
MRKYFGSMAAVCLLSGGLAISEAIPAAAQDQASGTTPPPKVLVIQNEALKPGHSGSVHEKTESAFVRAFTAAKWPEHYLGMDALSGKPRSLFFLRYDSLDAWQKDNDATQKDPLLSAALEAALTADSQQLDAFEQSVYNYREDLSLHAGVKIEDMRYMEIMVFKIRPGHGKDWDTLVKMYTSAYDKAPGAHWATYEKLYGTESGSRYLAITPLKSLAEADQEMLNDKTVAAAMTPDQSKKMSELNALVVESVETHLFAINPKISYVPDSWAAASPTFWGQK